jgi:hypothetical protein
MSGAKTGGVAASTDILIVLALCKKLLILLILTSNPVSVSSVFL